MADQKPFLAFLQVAAAEGCGGAGRSPLFDLLRKQLLLRPLRFLREAACVDDRCGGADAPWAQPRHASACVAGRHQLASRTSMFLMRYSVGSATSMIPVSHLSAVSVASVVSILSDRAEKQA